MPTLADYRRKLDKAIVANDGEAVAYFQSKIAELEAQPTEAPKEEAEVAVEEEDKPSANAGSKRRAKREAARTERLAAEQAPENNDPAALQWSEEKLRSTVKKAKANGDTEAAKYFDNIRKLKSATAKNDKEAVEYFRGNLGLEALPIEMSGIDQASAAVSKFTEWSTGLGDELGAVGRMMGGSVADLMHSDKTVGQIWEDNAQWGNQIDRVREGMDNLAEANPALNNAAAIAGGITGLAIPAATLAKAGTAAKIGMGAAEGAAYGAASGREAEGRLEGAAIGAVAGGALTGAAVGVPMYIAKRAANKEAAAEQRLNDLGYDSVEDYFTGDVEVDGVLTEVLNQGRKAKEAERTAQLELPPEDIQRILDEQNSERVLLAEEPEAIQEAAQIGLQRIRNSEDATEIKKIERDLRVLRDPSATPEAKAKAAESIGTRSRTEKEENAYYRRLERFYEGNARDSEDEIAAAMRESRKAEEGKYETRTFDDDELNKTTDSVSPKYDSPMDMPDNQWFTMEQLAKLDEVLGKSRRLPTDEETSFVALGQRQIDEVNASQAQADSRAAYIAKREEAYARNELDAANRADLELGLGPPSVVKQLDPNGQGVMTKRQVMDRLAWREAELKAMVGSPYRRTQMDFVRGIEGGKNLANSFTDRIVTALRPKSHSMRRNVGEGFSNAVVRGLIKAQRNEFDIDYIMHSDRTVEKLDDLFTKDNDFAAAMLNQSSSELSDEARQGFYDIAKKIAKKEGIEDFDRAMEQIAALSNNLNTHASETLATSFRHFDSTGGAGKPVYMHVSTQPKEMLPGAKKVKEADRTLDALAKSDRGTVKSADARKFQSPFASHRMHLKNLNSQTSLAESLDLRVAGTGTDVKVANDELNKVLQGKWMAEALEERLTKEMGYSEGQIENAVDSLRDVTVNASTAMNAELQVLRNLTYFRLLAKPYSAVLNASELSQIAVTQGIMETGEALGSTLKHMPNDAKVAGIRMGDFLGADVAAEARKALTEAHGPTARTKGAAFDAEVQGLVRTLTNEVTMALPTGRALTGVEFVETLAEGSKTILDLGMSASGTKLIDLGIKETALRAAFNRGRSLVKSTKGTLEFVNEQKKYFNDEELSVLVSAMRELGAKGQHGEKTLEKWVRAGKDTVNNRKAQLVMDHNMLQLARMQPTTSADMPEWALRHPNGRFFYIFMNFAIKQAEFVHEGIISELRKGNIGKAANFATRYAVLTGGLTGAILEGRDMAWKDKENSTPSTGVFPVDQWELAGIDLGKLGNKILWRSGLALTSNVGLGLTPMNYGYYGTEAFKKNPVVEIARDRLIGFEPLESAYDGAKQLHEGKYPKAWAKMNPFNREMDDYLEELWEGNYGGYYDPALSE